MKAFIDSLLPLRNALLCSALLLGVVLSGCQGSKPREAADGGAAVTDPYLRNRAEVPGAAQTAFDAALTAQRAQRWNEAEQQFKQLTEKYPQYSGPYLNLALVYAQTQRPQLAEQFFKQAMQVNPNNLGACDQYGIWLRGQGRFTDAEAVYQQALARWPDHADTHLNLGILYELYMGRLPQALEHYQRYVELNADEKSPVRGWVTELQRRVKNAG